MVMADYTINKKRVRDDDSSELDIPEVKKLREDLLLGILDEPYFDAENQDLDSVMKSFEEELSSCSASSGGVVLVDLTSESGESQPELGYLLEASDDELGLPPSKREDVGEKSELTELKRVDSGENGGLWEFDENIPSFDSFELGSGENFNNNNNNNTDDYAAFDDGLFEYSSVSFDYPDYSWRLGTLPAE